MSVTSTFTASLRRVIPATPPSPAVATAVFAGAAFTSSDGRDEDQHRGRDLGPDGAAQAAQLELHVDVVLVVVIAATRVVVGSAGDDRHLGPRLVARGEQPQHDLAAERGEDDDQRDEHELHDQDAAEVGGAQRIEAADLPPRLERAGDDQGDDARERDA